MTKKMKFKGYDAFKVCQVYAITKYKDNCIFETKFLGYTLTKDICANSGKSYLSDIKNTVISGLHVSFGIKDEFELEILTLDEIKDIVKDTIIIHT